MILQRMSLKPACDYLVYVAVRLLICVIQALPIRLCDQLARALAYLAHDILQIRGSLLEENLRHAFPEMSAEKRWKLGRRSWRHLCLMVFEIAHAPRKIHDTTWRNYVHIHNAADHINAVMQRRPVVMLLGHFGNFEMLGYMAGILGYPTNTVARPLDNPYLHEYLMKFRRATGQFILPKNGSAPLIAKVMEANGTLALLCDQNAGVKGCWVEFFNRPAAYHKAIALFSMTTDAPVLFTYLRRTDGIMQFEMGIEGIYDPRNVDSPLGIQEMTQWYNDLLERVVKRDPEQYWWLHNRWKDDRPREKERRARRLAKQRSAPERKAA
ncbi:MAG: lysophospholipid acyltransferase family protein [Pirellulaceae bacterium]